MRALTRWLVAVISMTLTLSCSSAPASDAGVCLQSARSSLVCLSGHRLVCGAQSGPSFELTANEKCELTTDSLKSPLTLEASGELRQCDQVFGHVCFGGGDSLSFTTSEGLWGCRAASNLIVDGGAPVVTGPCQ